MKIARYAACAAIILFLTGCANQTTDPHQGGLFSYNPEAYEQRIQERQQHLQRVEQENKTLQEQDAVLSAEKISQEKQQAALKKELAALTASTKTLKKEVQDATVKTLLQKRKRGRILSKIKTVQSSLAATDNIPDPEEKRLELERLKKRRDQLEREAEELMRL